MSLLVSPSVTCLESLFFSLSCYLVYVTVFISLCMFMNIYSCLCVVHLVTVSDKLVQTNSSALLDGELA